MSEGGTNDISYIFKNLVFSDIRLNLYYELHVRLNECLLCKYVIKSCY